MKKKIYAMFSVFTIVSILSVPFAMAGSEITGNVTNNNRAGKQTSLAILGSTAVTGGIVAE